MSSRSMPPEARRLPDPVIPPRCSSSIGDNSLLGDPRWAGLYGVEADFVAEEHCKICCISAEGVEVRCRLSEGAGSIAYSA